MARGPLGGKLAGPNPRHALMVILHGYKAHPPKSKAEAPNISPTTEGLKPVIVEYIRYDLKTHTAEQLIDSYRRAGEHLKAAPECLGFELTRCEEAPTLLILRILWRSSRDHIEGFRRGPHFAPFLREIRPYFDEIAEMRHYAETGVEHAVPMP